MVQEADQITLIANISALPSAESSLPDGYAFRQTSDQDAQELANLYFAAYPRDIVETEAAALEELEITFKGEYGALDLSASPLVTAAGNVVTAVLTVKEAPWDDTPPGPFFIEVIVHPDHRGLGLGRSAVLLASARLLSQGEQTVGGFREGGEGVEAGKEGGLAKHLVELGYQADHHRYEDQKSHK